MDQQFPIRGIVPVQAHDDDANASLAADNTSSVQLSTRGSDQRAVRRVTTRERPCSRHQSTAPLAWSADVKGRVATTGRSDGCPQPLRHHFSAFLDCREPHQIWTTEPRPERCQCAGRGQHRCRSRSMKRVHGARMNSARRGHDRRGVRPCGMGGEYLHVAPRRRGVGQSRRCAFRTTVAVARRMCPGCPTGRYPGLPAQNRPARRRT